MTEKIGCVQHDCAVCEGRRRSPLALAVDGLQQIIDAPKGSMAHELRAKAMQALAAIAVAATRDTDPPPSAGGSESECAHLFVAPEATDGRSYLNRRVCRRCGLHRKLVGAVWVDTEAPTAFGYVPPSEGGK